MMTPIALRFAATVLFALAAATSTPRSGHRWCFAVAAGISYVSLLQTL